MIYARAAEVGVPLPDPQSLCDEWHPPEEVGRDELGQAPDIHPFSHRR
jgi:hypothetical protein